MMKIILASSSPRRQELLALAHVDFDVCQADIDESWQQGESALAYIERMVVDKARAVCAKLVATAPTLILTADTIGVLADGEILVKPTDKQDAFAMWQKMSDATHQVWTAVQASLLVDNQQVWSERVISRTDVTFVALTDEMKEYYWGTGEPCDKAGAYAIQGFGATWVKSIHGNYTNVVGLPLPEVMTLIAKASFMVNDK